MLYLSADRRVMAAEFAPYGSMREAAFLQPVNLATFILGQVMVAARHGRISRSFNSQRFRIAWPASKKQCLTCGRPSLPKANAGGGEAQTKDSVFDRNHEDQVAYECPW